LTEQGRIFREAWIVGIAQHYPGKPKASYIMPWDETPEWERESTAKLTRLQKGRFVALCWIGQIYKHFPDPKPAYVADWDDLPRWQQETDADIFERIEQDAAA
jgi:hypothetical protein